MDFMNTITPGSVVEVATSRGLNHAIISNINGDEVTGYLVRAHDHSEVFAPISCSVDQITFVEPNERGAVTGFEDEATDGVVIFRDDEGIYVRVIGGHAGRYVRNVEEAVNATVTYFLNLGRYEDGERTKRMSKVTASILEEMLAK